MAALLDDEWLAAAAEALTGVPGDGEATGVVQYVVTGAPGGKATVHLEVDRGAVGALVAGAHPDPDCVVQLAAADVGALLAGEVTMDVLYMRGTAKVDGDHVLWILGLAAARRHPAWAEACAAIVAATD